MTGQGADRLSALGRELEDGDDNDQMLGVSQSFVLTHEAVFSYTPSLVFLQITLLPSMVSLNAHRLFYIPKPTGYTPVYPV